MCWCYFIFYWHLFLGTNRFSSMTHIYLAVPRDSQVVLAAPGSAELLLPAMCVVWFWFKWCSLCLNSILCYWSQVTHRQAWTPLQRDTCALPGPPSLPGEQSRTVTHGQGGEGGRHRPCCHTCCRHWSTAEQSMCSDAQISDLPLEVTPEKDLSCVLRISTIRAWIKVLEPFFFFLVPQIFLAVWWSLWIP